jgi:hypothetical protein
MDMKLILAGRLCPLNQSQVFAVSKAPLWFSTILPTDKDIIAILVPPPRLNLNNLTLSCSPKKTRAAEMIWQFNRHTHDPGLKLILTMKFLVTVITLIGLSDNVSNL